MENMNIPPKPYKCNVRLPVRSINGMEARVIRTLINERRIIQMSLRILILSFVKKNQLTIIAPIPIVANLALSSVKPALVNSDVE